MNFNLSLFLLLAMVTLIFITFLVFSIYGTLSHYKKTKSFFQVLKKNIILYIITILILIAEVYVVIDLIRIKAFIFILPVFLLTIVSYFEVGPIYSKILNNKMRREIKNFPIYIRDIDIEYSPAVLSYLINLKLEQKKDLIATILNICAKGALNLNQTNNQITFERTNKQALLTEDEQYLYDYLTGETGEFFYSKWKNIIKREYDKYSFSKDISYSQIVVSYTALCFLPLIIGFFLLPFNIKIYNVNLFYLIVFYVILLGLFNTIFIIFGIISSSLKNNWIEETDKFRRIYSVKGIEEVIKWEKFKNFIKDFTIINQRKIKEIVLLEKYLSYAMALNLNKEYFDVNNAMLDNIINGNFYEDHIKELFSDDNLNNS